MDSVYFWLITQRILSIEAYIYRQGNAHVYIAKIFSRLIHIADHCNDIHLLSNKSKICSDKQNMMFNNLTHL